MERVQELREQAQKAEAAMNQAGREKYWSELSIEEKIERIRQMVNSQSLTLDRLGQFSSEVAGEFRAHSHSALGQPVVPVDREPTRVVVRPDSWCRCANGGDPDKVYF